eukprot:306381-Prymnesium_polylepis.1
MSADFGTCDTSGGTARQRRHATRNCCKIRDTTTAKGVRMDHRHSGSHSPRPFGRRVAVWTSCWA